MKRSSSSLQFFAAAINTSPSTATSTVMSSRPSFRGSRSRGRGRGGAWSCGQRGYSDRANGDSGEDGHQFVSGDSHFGQARDTNRSFRPQDSASFRNFLPSPPYNRVPPPPSYNRVQPSPSYNRVPPPLSYNRVPLPPTYNNRVPPPQSSNIVPPSPSYNLCGPPQPLCVPPQQPYVQNKPLYRPPGPLHFDSNQQFRPSWQHQQQLRPRPPKDLEYRNWQYANPQPSPECERFTILSYNILADSLARDHWDKLYFHIPRHLLDWERRRRSILFELGLWSADIICLQEVDRFQDLKEELELQGYNGIWKIRTGNPVDGCAIFWRNSRFKLLYEESLEFSKVGLRDNVAQICVFQSLAHCADTDTSSLTSLAHSKKLVVCNIHVLYNPKRGEIKLGQVRVLLSRAHAVSKLWDDAPLVLCGDFNSTPKSPLYNFIAEQKLDLSELPRDKVSGQASAEIHTSRPFNPRYGAQSTENSAQASSNGAQVNRNNPLDFQKPESPEQNFGNGPFTDCLSQSDCSLIVSNESSFIVENSKRNNDQSIEQCGFQGMDGCSDEMKSTMNMPHKVLEEGANLLSEDAASSFGLVQDVVNDLTAQESCYKGLDTMSNCNTREFASVAEPLCGSTSAPDNKGTSSLGMSIKPHCPHQSSQSLEVSLETARNFSSASAVNEKDCTSVSYTSSQHSHSWESTSSNSELDEKMESLSLKEELEGTKEDGVHEDDITFLSALHHGSSIPSHPNQFEELHEPVKKSTNLDSQEFRSLGEENSDNTPAIDWENNAVEKSKYDPSAWTPAEIETATGSPDCTVMQHALKLKSVYGEIQDSSGTRDSAGEPVVTSYHRRFMGTVDYMWRSEGLQTARVLAPIPKHAMLWTKGFPTKKWGSDHIALVSELVFMGDISNQNTEVQ